MYTPSLISMDFETALTDGTPSIDYWRHDFRVTSCAFAWRREDGSIKSVYCVGENVTREVLETLGDIPIIVHNMAFEAGVCMYRFPEIELNLAYDTMRIVQVADGGGSDIEKYKIAVSIEDLLAQVTEDETIDKYGLGLEKCGYRWLGEELQGHKQEAHNWLRENGVKKGKEGANLHLLPPDILQRYNESDAIVTLRLFEIVTDFLKGKRYDWTFDHSLYTKISIHIARAKGRGVLVDTDLLQLYVDTKNQELIKMEEDFRKVHPKEIKEIEEEILAATLGAYKTLKGRNKCAERIKEQGGIKFNINSRNQKKRLFVDKLGMKTPFVTKKGNPSFRKTHVHIYGEAGKLLKTKGTLMIGRKQAETLILMSEYDGRVHLGLRGTGTKTGRFSGGNKNE